MQTPPCAQSEFELQPHVPFWRQRRLVASLTHLGAFTHVPLALHVSTEHVEPAPHGVVAGALLQDVVLWAGVQT